MLNAQRPAPERDPDSVSLTPKQLRPLRIVVHNQNSAGQWLQLSDCVSADLLLGEWWAVIEWLCLFRHCCLISFYERYLRTRDFNRISNIYLTWRWDDEESGSGKKGCGRRRRYCRWGASHPFY